MTEFVGRTGSMRVYSYPETRRASTVPTPFARNFAAGPKTDTSIDGSQIQWNFVEAGSPPTPADVPITCAVTGIVLITGTLTVENSSGGPVVVQLSVQVESSPIAPPVTVEVLIPAGGVAVIPFLYETTPTDTPIGVTKNVQVAVTGTGATLLAESSVIEVQEVSVATG